MKLRKIFEIGAEGGGESIYQLESGRVIRSSCHISDDDYSGQTNNYEEYASFREYWNNFKSKYPDWYNFHLVHCYFLITLLRLSSTIL